MIKNKKFSKSKSLRERFLFNVNKTSTCWEWLGSKDKDGYGRLGWDYKTLKAHRVSYSLCKGDTGTLLVCHTCDNPGCVNPEHLFLGSAADNTKDMILKGRQGSGNTKLTETQVSSIKSLLELGFYQAQIAKLFGVTQGLIGHINRGLVWNNTNYYGQAGLAFS